ncbi:MAG: extracellular solute-binding protein [Lachnospiraceae bacterium]|nr:extracellular solute-binding protein [Lachnospiraceae bacterium]
MKKQTVIKRENNKTKYFYRLGFVLVLVLLFMQSGCASKETEATELTLIHGWGSTESDHVAMRQIYEDFEKENPDIQLNLVSMPNSEDVIGKAGDMISVGKIPDIIFTGGSGTDSVYQFMVDHDYALDLMPYVEADETLRQDIADSTLDYWKMKDGGLYTISDVLLMSGYWYNEDIFNEAGVQEPPKTWDDFLKACEKIQNWARDERKEVIPVMLDTDHVLYLTDTLLASEDALDIIETDHVQARTEEFGYALGMLKSIYEYSKNVENNYTYRDTLQSFNNGNTAFYMNGVWANSMINADMNVKYAAFPSKDGSSIACISSNVGYILGKTGDAKRTDAAIRFIKYMLSDEVQKRILEETGQIPSSPAIELSDFEETNQRFYQAVECMLSADKTINTPVNIWSSKLSNMYTRNIADYLNDKITTETLIETLE